MSDLLLPIGLLSTFFAVGLVGVVVDLSMSERRKALRLLKDQVGRTSARTASIREQELARSFAERAVLPAVVALRTVGFRITPVGMRRRLARKLVLAGNPAGWDAERIAALKLVGLAGGVGISLAVSRLAHFSGFRAVGLAAFLGLIGFVVPDAVLDAAVKKRKDAIRKALPDTMDLLTISVEAGLGLDAALAQVAHNSSGPLAIEVSRMLHEMQLGVVRQDAFRHLADRTQVQELKGFVLAMIQAEVFGVSIAKVLRAQAKQHRIKRRQRAEQKAMQVPVKILFPLIFCILPALFIVVMGPGIIRVARQVFGVF